MRYTRLWKMKSVAKEETMQDALLAACLYLACRQEDKPRTHIGRAKEYIVKQLGLLEKPLQEAHAGDYMRRFCSALGLNN